MLTSSFNCLICQLLKDRRDISLEIAAADQYKKL